MIVPFANPEIRSTIFLEADLCGTDKGVTSSSMAYDELRTFRVEL